MENMINEEKTYAHSSLVSQISAVIAKNAHHNAEDIHIITEAAHLHDLGKNYIPKEILGKPGRLTEEEFEIVKAHTQAGFEYLIRQAKIFLTAAIVALQHHEKPIGNGYAGVTNIHTYAKLVAIADVFDALMSKRPYKEKWTPEETVNYMKENTHKEFDAYYMDVFVSSLDEVLSLYHMESDLLSAAYSKGDNSDDGKDG
jgi:HD-GYP domain-containing protein (c-di-GMP phosphodiesterase class II)